MPATTRVNFSRLVKAGMTNTLLKVSCEYVADLHLGDALEARGQAVLR